MKEKGVSSIIVIAIVIVIVAIGVGSYFLLKGGITRKIHSIEATNSSVFYHPHMEEGYAVLKVIVSAEVGDDIALYKNQTLIDTYYIEYTEIEQNIQLKMANRFTTPSAGTYTVKISRDERVLATKTITFGGALLNLASVEIRYSGGLFYSDSIYFNMRNLGDLPAIFKQIQFEIGENKLFFDVMYEREYPSPCVVLPNETKNSAEILGGFFSLPFKVDSGKSLYIKVLDSVGNILATYSGIT